MSFTDKFIEVSTAATTLRTAVFTVGHFLIDVVVISLITGSSIEVAGTAALVGPAINGAWFWMIDRFWSQRHADDERQHSFTPVKGAS